METKEKRTKILAGLLALVGLLLVWTLATAGDLEPNEPPGPTMKTLDEIYDAAASVSEREGYMEHAEVDPNNPHTFFTVPAGKCFVLLKLNFEVSYLSISSTGGLYIDWDYFRDINMDFPDRCIAINSGESLTASSSGDPRSWGVTIVGYFYDVE